MNQPLELSLAAALLMEEGELTLTDIEALPFVEDEETAFSILTRLLSMFEAEPTQRRVPGAFGAWETVIELKQKKAPFTNLTVLTG